MLLVSAIFDLPISAPMKSNIKSGADNAQTVYLPVNVNARGEHVLATYRPCDNKPGKQYPMNVCRGTNELVLVQEHSW
jgi:hypothetical protein